MDFMVCLLKLQGETQSWTHPDLYDVYNVGQNSWITYNTCCVISPPLPQSNVVSWFFVSAVVEIPNIDWIGKGRDLEKEKTLRYTLQIYMIFQ